MKLLFLIYLKKYITHLVSERHDCGVCLPCRPDRRMSDDGRIFGGNVLLFFFKVFFWIFVCFSRQSFKI